MSVFNGRVRVCIPWIHSPCSNGERVHHALNRAWEGLSLLLLKPVRDINGVKMIYWLSCYVCRPYSIVRDIRIIV